MIEEERKGHSQGKRPTKRVSAITKIIQLNKEIKPAENLEKELLQHEEELYVGRGSNHEPGHGAEPPRVHTPLLETN